MFGNATRKAFLVALGCCAATAITASSANAAPPANDSFAAPVNLPSGTSNTVVGTTTESTIEANEPEYIGSGGSVWYTWTAPGNGTASFNTCETEIDHVITVFTGATLTPTMTRIAEDDDSCGELQGGASLGAAVTFATVAGTQYRIAVSAYAEEEEGPFVLKGPQSPPPPEQPVIPATPAVPTIAPAIPASPAANKKCKKGFKKVKGKCKKIKKKKKK